MQTHGQVILFLGPPGSGKGTQAARLSSALDIPAISTGELLRRESESGSPLGKSVEAVLAAGKLVDDESMGRVVGTRLQQRDCANGCILDGYPRTVDQARFLDAFLAKLHRESPIVFDFEISPEVVVSRLSSRRECSQCGRSFSVSGHSAEMFCDRDGAPLIRRSDDNPASIRRRLALYERNARELARYYCDHRDHRYHRISANRTPDEIAAQLLTLADSTAPADREIVITLKEQHFHAAEHCSRGL